jgi:hypothetical protein
MLKRWAFESFLSDPIKIHFVEAGLLDKSVLRADDRPTLGRRTRALLQKPRATTILRRLNEPRSR